MTGRLTLNMFRETSLWINPRSNHRRCSMKKVVLENFAKFTGKHLCQGPFFNNVAGMPATLLKKCFPVNFAKFSRKLFLQNTPGGCLCNPVKCCKIHMVKSTYNNIAKYCLSCQYNFFIFLKHYN